LMDLSLPQAQETLAETLKYMDTGIRNV
jgi:hypothetical protein